MRGADTFGPFLRAGCAGAAWVRGGSLGSGMRAGRRCLAPQVGGESVLFIGTQFSILYTFVYSPA